MFVYSSVDDFHTKCIIHIKYYTQSYNLATEQRYSHEYGEISAVGSLGFDFAIPKTRVSQQSETNSDVVNVKSKFDSSLLTSTNTASSEFQSRRDESSTDLNQSSPGSGNVDSVVKFDSMLMKQETMAPHPPPTNVGNMKKISQSETINMKSKFDAILSGTANSKDVPSVQNMPPQPTDSNKESWTHKDAEYGRTIEKTMVPADAVGLVLKQEGFDLFR